MIVTLTLIMFNFHDATTFRLIHSFEIPAVYTWGDGDRDKRETIRKIAREGFRKPTFIYSWCGFSIVVERNVHGRDLDIENVPKLIIDSFSGWQLRRDRSKYKEVELYPEDTLRYVKAINVGGKFVEHEDNTLVNIYGRIN